MGTMLAVTQFLGRVPEDRDRWNRQDKGKEINSAATFDR